MSQLNIEKFRDKKFNLNYQDYNYILKLDCITKKNKIIPLSEHLVTITMLHLFDDFVFPVLKVSLMLNKNLYNQIIEELDNDLKWRLNIQKVLVDPSNENKVTGLPIKYLKDIIIKPVDFNRNLYGKQRTDKDYEYYSHNNEIPLEIEFIAEDHFKISRKRLKGIFQKIDLQNILAYSFKECLPKNNLILHEPNNNKIYDQIVLSGKNLPNQIKEFQEIYGIYESGLRLFFDYNKYYCLPNDLLKCKVKKEKNEYENVYIYVQDTNQSRSIDISGSYKDKDNERYVILAESTNGIATSDVSSRETKGEKVKSFSYDYKKDRISENINKNESGISNKKPKITNLKENHKEKRIYKKYDNDYTIPSKIYENIKDNLRIVLMMRSIDDEILKMNRRYYIQYRNTTLNNDYKGTYQITGKISVFSRNGHVFEYNTLAIFNRLTKEILSRS